MTEPARPRPIAVWQPARIVDIRRQTERVRSYLIEPETHRHWLPGQHVDVRLTAEDGYTAQRSYSIANNWREGAAIELAIEHLADGEVSGYFHDIAQSGDRIEIKVPLGYHFVWEAATGPALLIAGGSGVVPLMSMVRHHAENRVGRDIALLYSARQWADVIFADELLRRRDGEDGFECRFALTRETASHDRDFSRRIDSSMLREVIGERPELAKNVYICGSNAFVGAAEVACMEVGISSEALKTERYGS